MVTEMYLNWIVVKAAQLYKFPKCNLNKRVHFTVCKLCLGKAGERKREREKKERCYCQKQVAWTETGKRRQGLRRNDCTCKILVHGGD